LQAKSDDHSKDPYHYTVATELLKISLPNDPNTLRDLYRACAAKSFQNYLDMVKIAKGYQSFATSSSLAADISDPFPFSNRISVQTSAPQFKIEWKLPNFLSTIRHQGMVATEIVIFGVYNLPVN
jgi:hypothetical protein